jgi:hypothetical protein
MNFVLKIKQMTCKGRRNINVSKHHGESFLKLKCRFLCTGKPYTVSQSQKNGAHK